MSIFKKKNIPTELWENNTLYVPQKLADLYEEVLKNHNVYDKALKEYKGKIIGGSTDAETLKHFYARFLASVTRVEYLTLNPEGKFTPIQKDIVTMLSEGCINILNIPCGTGGDILSLLMTLTTLRSKKMLPSTPLNIRITAGDISPKAREIYNQFLEKASILTLTQGLRVEWDTLEWDAKREPTTALLVDHLLDQSCEPKEYLVFISAFSGISSELLNDFMRSVSHFESRLDSRKSTTIWIEPKGSGDTFFKRIFMKIKDWNWYRRTEERSEAEFSWLHPFTKINHTGTLCVRKHSGALIND